MEPLSDNEVLDLAHRISIGAVAPDQVDWGSMVPTDERRVMTLARYETECRTRRAKQRSPVYRRAFRLLRSVLDGEQRRQLSRGRCFVLRGSRGNLYRLYPGVGLVEAVQPRGKRLRRVATYCFHPDDDDLPAGDVATVQVCAIASDEEDFLLSANVTVTRGREHWWKNDPRATYTERRWLRQEEERAEALADIANFRARLDPQFQERLDRCLVAADPLAAFLHEFALPREGD